MHPSLALRMVRPTGRLMAAQTPGKPTFIQRVKQVPAELWPLAAVVGFALSIGVYSISRKFAFDKNLRLSRQGPAGRDDKH